jgi:CheY-like chemotaxis protein
MSQSNRRKLKILVVDDEDAVCECIRVLLSFDGHDVQAFTNSSAALDAFEAGRFDMVFVDYSMPGMKGDELARAIRMIEPNLPIVMVTGNAPVFGTLPGVSFVVDKPVMLDDLRLAIARASMGAPFHRSSA